MKNTDHVFCQLSEQTKGLLEVSRQIFDKEAARIMEEHRETSDRLYSLLYKRAGITDPYLRGSNKTRQALESGEFPIADNGYYFDGELNDLKRQFNETNESIYWWGIQRDLNDVPDVEDEC